MLKRIVLSGAAVLTAAAGLNAALTQNFYTNTSVLSSGNWVKVGVAQTGVYEISYEALRDMGFSDPSKVSVYGRGGHVLPESFVSNSGVPVLTDDLASVSIIHEGGKIYFYGLGPEDIAFESDSSYPSGGYFTRKSNNIYSRHGYYFLTDSKPVNAMGEKIYTSSTKVEKGVSYVYHELDSLQNTTQSGQLFWGELIGEPGLHKRGWDIEMPDALTEPGVMECVFYIADTGDWNYGNFSGTPKINYGVLPYDGFKGEAGKDFFSTPYTPDPSALYYAPHEPTLAQIAIPGKTGNAFVEFSDVYDNSAYSNLDYWVVSYQCGMPTFCGADGRRLSQQLIALPSIAKNATAQIELENPASLVVLDITNESVPVRLRVNQQGDKGTVGVKNTGKTAVLMVFDKSQPQLQISGYEQNYSKIENQNLHGYKEQGADFIIITTPKFRPYAEQIADLHRKHDGIKVVVATTEECYNEFSGGTPDPMAYRGLARMLYFSDCKPKNMMLMGPLYGDFRGIRREHEPMEGIIAYQSPSISISRGAHNINDFYGMMSDVFRTDYYERNEVQVGVAIMPVKFESEAEIIVDKIARYLDRDDHAYYFNLVTAVGGLKDAHTHDAQMRDILKHISQLDYAGTMSTALSIDTYGNAEARKKFLNKINEGCNIFSYFGHGAEQFLGQDKYFFNAGDVYTLRNTTLPFALFGGCQITNTDRGYRGLGETLVTGTPNGCIGSLVSARDTWSGQNYEFFKSFYICLYTEGSTITSKKREKPVTIGEVYAKVKNYSSYSNELAYQLLCDPALVIPANNRMVSVKKVKPEGEPTVMNPGDKFMMTGTITHFDGTPDENFNGNVVIRLAAPEKIVKAGMIETKEDPKNLEYVYRDDQISMAVADVKNGRFEAEIHVPSSMATYVGKDALMYFAAYDKSTKVAASTGYTVAVAAAGQSSAEAGDKVPPVVESLAFDNRECSVNVAVSDNLALNLSTNPLDKGLYLYIDGKERSEAHFVQPVLENGRPAYSKSVLIDGLAYGDHSARVKVKDAAGNITEHEITFTYEPEKAKYTLLKDEDSAQGVTNIKISGLVPAQASVIILSPEGNEIWRGEVAGASVEWNHADAQGKAVAPGHYKAYLIETGKGMQKGHSEPIDIPVI